MNIGLDEAHLQLRQSTEKFTDKEVVPIAAELDRKEARIPESLIRKMGEMGYFGIMVPEEFGGGGMDQMAHVIVIEELSRGWLSVGSLPNRNIMFLDMLLWPGNEKNRDKWLPKLISGELQAAWAATEPEAGSDAANVRLEARKSGDEWILNGQKMFCTNAERADILVVLTRTDPKAATKHRGLTHFAVEKPAGGWNPPQLVGTKIPTVGYHGMGTYELAFQDCRVPAENQITELNKGFYALARQYETARIGFAARCVGVARAAFEKALAYAPTRVQFGQPISKFQAVRFKLADMATSIDVARQ